jgi:hypothetical protein
MPKRPSHLGNTGWKEMRFKAAILTDSDECRKPTVHHGAVGLAVALDRAAAAEVSIPLPPVRREELDGMVYCDKQGIDDFRYREGPEALLAYVKRHSEPPRERDLDDYRAEIRQAADRVMMEAARVAVTGSREPKPAYVLLGEAGAGKSRAVGDAMEAAGERAARAATMPEGIAKALMQMQSPRSDTLSPTHEQCQQTVDERKAIGVETVKEPPITEETCHKEMYPLVEEARETGVSAPLVACPGCAHQGDCTYQRDRREARAARNAAEVDIHAGVTEIIVGVRELVVIEEDPSPCRKQYRVRARGPGLGSVIMIAQAAGREAGSERMQAFAAHLVELAGDLKEHLEAATVPEVLTLLPKAVFKEEIAPEEYMDALNRARVDNEIAPDKEALMFVLDIARGGVRTILRADDSYLDKSGPKLTKVSAKVLIGVSKNELKPWPVMLLNDATANLEEVGAILGRKVVNITPPGRLRLLKPILQIVPKRDITMGRAQRNPDAVMEQLHGVVNDMHAKRIWIITLKPFADHLRKLLNSPDGPPWLSWIAKVSHFGGGEARGSNAWGSGISDADDRPDYSGPGGYDALLVFGTPRVDVPSLRGRLMLVGKEYVAAAQPEHYRWHKDWWLGRTESGRLREVATVHYGHHDWHSAHWSLVVAQLKQAVGRARAILPTGIPAYVVTTENLAPLADGIDGTRTGIRVADCGFEPISDGPLTPRQQQAIDSLRDVAYHTTAGVAMMLHISRQAATKLLKPLAKRGLVVRSTEYGTKGQTILWSLP